MFTYVAYHILTYVTESTYKLVYKHLYIQSVAHSIIWGEIPDTFIFCDGYMISVVIFCLIYNSEAFYLTVHIPLLDNCSF